MVIRSKVGVRIQVKPMSSRASYIQAARRQPARASGLRSGHGECTNSGEFRAHGRSGCVPGPFCAVQLHYASPGSRET